MTSEPQKRVAGIGAATADQLSALLSRSISGVAEWMATYGPYESHPASAVSEEALLRAQDALVDRLKDNYPFFHPRYVGQMLKPPHPAAFVGYATAMLINPNNHALDGGPATAQLEKEVVGKLATMFGYTDFLGHLTSSGTIANLEALFVSREIHPGKGIAHSADAHYTHGRMSHILGMESHAVATDSGGRMDLDDLERLLRTGKIGTVVMTAGTTGLGAIDPIDLAVPLCARYGVRIHVDAAYGGFFKLIADDSADGVAKAPFDAIADCDSVVVDPHKHGLQPYGCGAVLFRDPSVQTFYRHDSPYTYFTSEDLHLGEISIECSRSGASAAALWMTLEVLPLTNDGLGQLLRAGRRATLAWARKIRESEVLELFQDPELDILSYFARSRSLSEIDLVSGHVLDAGMNAPPDKAVFVATYNVTPDAFAARSHDVDADLGTARILRSVVMKPETELIVDQLNAAIEDSVDDAFMLSRGFPDSRLDHESRT
jgi:glutamate/tyrosine decarboxylase-like PLP-dependent enzyme